MLNKDNFSKYYSLKEGLLIVVSGPSGAGKSSVCKEYVKYNPNAWLSISDTTRNPRGSEIDGVEYNFISEDVFENRVKEDYYLEYAGKYQHHYGTPKQQILDHMAKGQEVLLEIEMQGAAQIRKQFPNATTIFILPSTLNELERQIRDRKTESEEVIQLRMSELRQEINQIKHYDYVIINKYNELDKAVLTLSEIIKAQHFNVADILNQYKSLEN